MSITPSDWQVYLDGNIVATSQAHISVFDRGLEYGDAIMESILCFERRMFKLEEHIARLFWSAQHVRLPVPLPKAGVTQAVHETARANRFDFAHVKILLTRGTQSRLGVRPRPDDHPTLIVLCRPLDRAAFLPDSPTGIRLASVSVRKYPPTVLDPRIKSTNFLPNILAITEALDSDADEAVVLDDRGYVTECAAANIFAVKGRTIATPLPVAALEGITRATIMDLGCKAGYTVVERLLTQYDLRTADEVFITGTAAGVKSVVAVDKRPIGSGEPGPVFRELSHAFKEVLLTSAPLW